MDPTCPRCGSDAAVTWTKASDGTLYTCRFSHGGEGPVSWKVATKQRAVRASAAGNSAEPGNSRKPPARRPAAEGRAHATSATGSAPLSVNERGVAAVVDEVSRRGGHARVERDGNTRTVIVTGDGHTGEVRLVVRARTAGTWQTRASYGEPRVEEDHPTTFWVLVDLALGTRRCYVVPEWWIRNDISEKHDEYLRSRGGTRPVTPESDHHAIATDRVAQWIDRWDQIEVLRTS